MVQLPTIMTRGKKDVVLDDDDDSNNGPSLFLLAQSKTSKFNKNNIIASNNRNDNNIRNNPHHQYHYQHHYHYQHQHQPGGSETHSLNYSHSTDANGIDIDDDNSIIDHTESRDDDDGISLTNSIIDDSECYSEYDSLKAYQKRIDGKKGMHQNDGGRGGGGGIAAAASIVDAKFKTIHTPNNNSSTPPYDEMTMTNDDDDEDDADENEQEEDVDENDDENDDDIDIATTPLWKACWMGDIDEVYKLLLSLQHEQEEEEECLFDEQVNIINRLEPVIGTSPLYGACLNGHARVVMLLLQYYSNTSNRNGICPITTLGSKWGDTNLHAAAMCGNPTIVRMLLDEMEKNNYNVGNINCINADGETPLHVSTWFGHERVVEELLSRSNKVTSSAAAGTKVDINVMNKVGHTALQLAVYNGNTYLIRVLLESGADPTIVDYNDKDALHIAIERGFLESALLLSTHAINQRKTRETNNKKESLTQIKEEEEVEEVEQPAVEECNCSTTAHSTANSDNSAAAASGTTASTNAAASTANTTASTTTSSKYTADLKEQLFNHVEHGHIEALRALFDTIDSDVESSRIDIVNATNTDENTPLMVGCSCGHMEVIKYLLQKDASIQFTNSKGYNALYRASCNGHDDIVELLLQMGASADGTKNTLGQSSLYWAAYHGHEDVVDVLLQHGADPTSTDIDGKDPIQIASEHNHTSIVELMEEYLDQPNTYCNGIMNANIDNNNSSNNATNFTSNFINTNDTGNNTNNYNGGANNVSSSIIDTFTNSNNNQNETDVLVQYANHGEIDEIRALLEAKKEKNNKSNNKSNNNMIDDVINGRNEDGHTALYAASVINHLDMVSLLLQYGADANVTNRNGRSPLYGATCNGHVQIVQKLLQDGKADPDIPNEVGETPVYGACYYGMNEILELLLQYSADPTKPNWEGIRPYDVASFHGRSLLESVTGIRGQQDEDSSTSSYSQYGGNYLMTQPSFVTTTSSGVSTVQISNQCKNSKYANNLDDDSIALRSMDSSDIILQSARSIDTDTALTDRNTSTNKSSSQFLSPFLCK